SARRRMSSTRMFKARSAGGVKWCRKAISRWIEATHSTFALSDRRGRRERQEPRGACVSAPPDPSILNRSIQHPATNRAFDRIQGADHIGALRRVNVDHHIADVFIGLQVLRGNVQACL